VKKRIKVPKNWEDPPDSFERFKNLAKSLMATPKKEPEKQPAKLDNRKKLAKH
jgi:hypothetical protein